MAFEELAAAAFGDGDGVIRLRATRGAETRPRLVAVPRALPPAQSAWTALVAPFPHPGPSQTQPGVKSTDRRLFDAAREAALEAGADEALLIDEAGRLVEGSICNLFAVAADGVLGSPPLARGAVAGVARAVVYEKLEDARERDFRVDQPLRELIAVNAVRGAIPIVRLDGRDVGDGRAGPQARRLIEVLDRD
jgi:branched-subunit amino acid aminotransferase/4-amino-4-deoxychorismate lyase